MRNPSRVYGIAHYKDVDGVCTICPFFTNKKMAQRYINYKKSYNYLYGESVVRLVLDSSYYMNDKTRNVRVIVGVHDPADC